MNLGNKKSNLLILLAVFIVGGCGNFSGNYEEIESSTSSESTTTTTSSDSTASFVAVGNSGTVLKSSDGTTWTTVSATYEHPDNGTISLTGDFNGVAYGSSTFVAVGRTDNGSASIITSTDATAWTPRTSGTSNTLSDVTYEE